MNNTLSVALASLVAVGCALPQEAAGSSDEGLTITTQHPNPTSAEAHVTVSKLSPPEGTEVAPESCSMPPGWMAVSASFDSVLSPMFATELNPLLAGRPPMTVAVVEDGDGLWSMRASATVQKGTLQIFPSEHLTMPAGASVSASGFTTIEPIAGAWIAVLDAKSTLVWIPIANVAVHGSFVTGGCENVSVVVDASVPKIAGSVPIVTAEGQRTLGELLAAGNPAAGDEGWHVRLTFGASPAAVGL